MVAHGASGRSELEDRAFARRIQRAVKICRIRSGWRASGLWAALLIATAMAAADPATAAGTPRLPVGKVDGVRIVTSPKDVVVVFGRAAAPLWREVAGNQVTVSCTGLRASTGSSNSASDTFRAPKRGRTLHARVLGRRDYCRVWHAGYREVDPFVRESQLVVSVPLTQRGAVYLDEERKVRDMAVLLWTARPVIGGSRDGYATPDALLADVRDLSPSAAHTVMALGSPEDTPPAGMFGYYSDGADNAAVVALSASGRRLFIEVAANDVIRTNVLSFFLSEELTPPVSVESARAR